MWCSALCTEHIHIILNQTHIVPIGLYVVLNLILAWGVKLSTLSTTTPGDEKSGKPLQTNKITFTNTKTYSFGDQQKREIYEKLFYFVVLYS